MVSRKDMVPLSELMALTTTLLDRSISQPNILSYKPYPAQQLIHESCSPGKYVAGGNRAGKTDTVVVEAIMWATDSHPFRKRPANWGKGAIQQRFVTVDVTKGIEGILIPKFKRWVATSMCIDGSFDKSWDKNSYIFTFANGSTIDFVTHGMDMEKHGGVPRHIIYFDEEPPQPIFVENMMRLIDYDGWWVISATPTNGMTWTYDELWEPIERAIENGEEHPDLDIFTLSQAQNPYLKSENRNRFYIGASKEEREIREEGKFVAKSGLVFPNFKKPTHVVDPFIPPKSWEWYTSVDHGWNNPTAWYWHAVAPDGRIVTFAEHYADHLTVGEHSRTVLLREAAWGRGANVRTGDPAMKQGNGITGTSVLSEYARHGIYIGVEGVPHEVIIGIEKMQQYFRVPKSYSNGWGKDRPEWVITSNCTNLIRELQKLRWETYSSSSRAYALNKRETVHKKDDHGFDSVRYFATLMPDPSGDGRAYETRLEQAQPTTLDYASMMMRLRENENVTFDEDDSPNFTDDWQTTERWETEDAV